MAHALEQMYGNAAGLAVKMFIFIFKLKDWREMFGLNLVLAAVMFLN